MRVELLGIYSYIRFSSDSFSSFWDGNWNGAAVREIEPGTVIGCEFE